MIILSTLITFATGSCSPTFHTNSNAYGKSLGLHPRSTRKGQRWTWPGSVPHPTRMHHYAGLSSPQKTAWTAIAAEMNNDHSPHSITHYNGPIAFMQTNLFNRLQGNPYSDTAPATGGDPGPFTAQLQYNGLPSGSMLAVHTP